eukprot:GHVP01038107.1.p1 GENE.GHVP01038107.1~~GHVP01038107.1.p1  ORF type:complete len:908 (-),score=159.22 GHVP01038107.1:53-2776(-)
MMASYVFIAFRASYYYYDTHTKLFSLILQISESELNSSFFGPTIIPLLNENQILLIGEKFTCHFFSATGQIANPIRTVKLDKNLLGFSQLSKPNPKEPPTNPTNLLFARVGDLLFTASCVGFLVVYSLQSGKLLSHQKLSPFVEGVFSSEIAEFAIRAFEAYGFNESCLVASKRLFFSAELTLENRQKRNIFLTFEIPSSQSIFNLYLSLRETDSGVCHSNFVKQTFPNEKSQITSFLSNAAWIDFEKLRFDTAFERFSSCQKIPIFSILKFWKHLLPSKLSHNAFSKSEEGNEDISIEQFISQNFNRQTISVDDANISLQKFVETERKIICEMYKSTGNWNSVKERYDFNDEEKSSILLRSIDCMRIHLRLKERPDSSCWQEILTPVFTSINSVPIDLSEPCFGMKLETTKDDLTFIFSGSEHQELLPTLLYASGMDEEALDAMHKSDANIQFSETVSLGSLYSYCLLRSVTKICQEGTVLSDKAYNIVLRGLSFLYKNATKSIMIDFLKNITPCVYIDSLGVKKTSIPLLPLEIVDCLLRVAETKINTEDRCTAKTFFDVCSNYICFVIRNHRDKIGNLIPRLCHVLIQQVGVSEELSECRGPYSLTVAKHKNERLFLLQLLCTVNPLCIKDVEEMVNCSPYLLPEQIVCRLRRGNVSEALRIAVENCRDVETALQIAAWIEATQQLFSYQEENSQQIERDDLLLKVLEMNGSEFLNTAFHEEFPFRNAQLLRLLWSTNHTAFAPKLNFCPICVKSSDEKIHPLQSLLKVLLRKRDDQPDDLLVFLEEAAANLLSRFYFSKELNFEENIEVFPDSWPIWRIIPWFRLSFQKRVHERSVLHIQNQLLQSEKLRAIKHWVALKEKSIEMKSDKICCVCQKRIVSAPFKSFEYGKSFAHNGCRSPIFD